MRKVKQAVFNQMKKQTLKLKKSKKEEMFYKELIQEYKEVYQSKFIEQMNDLFQKNFNLSEYKDKLTDKNLRYFKRNQILILH